MNKFILSKYNNNSKKLIIGTFIIFCTIILIIGTTLAFFTGSDTKSTGNIVTTDINGTIGYTDNKDYMRNNLIPVIETDVVKFAMKNSLNNFTDNDVCKYNDEYNACSLYEFTITNNADVTQELLVSMSPTLNQYGNLYFIVLEGNRTSLTTNSKIVHNSTHIKQDTINFNDLDLILKPKESKTYTIVFYIKSLNIDQTSVDSGKTFAASIKVDSITTGYSMSTQVGEGCYNYVQLDDGTLKLTKFNGINHETGEPIESCGVIKDEKGLYSVTVPSLYAGVAVSTLGNTLFYQIDVKNFNPNDMSTLKLNRNMYIKEFIINEGITTIENGFIFDAGLFGEVAAGTFISVGYDFTKQQVIVEDRVIINLPNSLKHIGDYAFNTGYIKEIKISNNLEYIGNYSFFNTPLTSLTFEEGSKLITIGDSAFCYSNITTLTIPNSVQTIGESAFYLNENLTTLTFGGAEDGTSQLKEIGAYAFRSNDNLNYSTEDNPLIIPPSVEYIGDNAFRGSNTDGSIPTLKFIKYTGTYLDIINKEQWYGSGVTLLTD